MNITALGVRSYGLVNFTNNSEKPAFRVFLPDYKLRHMQESCNPVMYIFFKHLETTPEIQAPEGRNEANSIPKIPQILVATVANCVAQATCHPGLCELAVTILITSNMKGQTS
jgi:hypothetical protein